MFTPNIHYLFFLSWNPHIIFHMQIRLHLMLSPRRFYAGATDWVEDILLMERFFFFLLHLHSSTPRKTAKYLHMLRWSR